MLNNLIRLILPAPRVQGPVVPSDDLLRQQGAFAQAEKGQAPSDG